MSLMTALDYARHHGLTTNFSFPLLLDILSRVSNDHDEYLNSLETGNSSHFPEDEIDNLLTSHGTIPQEDRFELSAAESQLLTSAISQSCTKSSILMPEVWDNVLLDHCRIRNLKLPQPLLRIGGGDVDKDARKVKKGIVTVEIMDDIKIEWNKKIQTERSETTSNGYDDYDDLEIASQEIQQKLKAGKLHVSREAIVMLAKALDPTRSKSLAEHVYADDMKSTNPRTQNRWSPVIITIEDCDVDGEKTNGEAASVLDEDEMSIVSQAQPVNPMQKIDEAHDYYPSPGHSTAQIECVDMLDHIDELTPHQPELDINFTASQIEFLDKFDRSDDPDHHEESINLHREQSGDKNESCPDFNARKFEYTDTWNAFDELEYQDSLKSLQLEHSTRRYSASQELANQEQPLQKRRKTCHDNKSDEQNIMSSSPRTTDLAAIWPKVEEAFDAPEPTQDFLRSESRNAASFLQYHNEFMVSSESPHSPSVQMNKVGAAVTYLTIPRLKQYTPLMPWRSTQGLIPEYINGKVELLDHDMTEQQNLDWVPFPSIPIKSLMPDDLDIGSQYLHPALSHSDRIVNSSQLLWKEPGLRLLETCAGDIEDIDTVWDTQTESIVQTQVAVRDVHISCPVTETSHLLAGAVKLANPGLFSKKDTLSDRQPSSSTCDERTLACHTDLTTRSIKHEMIRETPSLFSATNSLSKFLHLRRNCVAANFLTNAGITTELECSVNDELARTDYLQHERTLDVKSISVMNNGLAQVDAMSSLLGLAIEGSNGARSVFVNNAVLQSHPALIRSLEDKADGKVVMVFRDFDANIETPVDIILNPTMCILFTNLQSLMQRPLPGQKNRSNCSTTRTLVQKASSNFEVIFVIITYFSSTSKEGTSSQDAAIAEFTAFCSRHCVVTKSIRPIWVPHSSKITLDTAINSWTRYLIFLHALNNEHVQYTTFLHDTTLWELFLRRTGINPMAAQIVLGKLHRSSSNSVVLEHGQDDRVCMIWGLRHFVKMSYSERLSMFGDILGTNLVGRISHIIDQRVSF